MSAWLILAAIAAEAPFPEHTPELIEACLTDAVARKEVSKTIEVYAEEYKYICGDEVAMKFWNHLEAIGGEAWEQATDNGVWASHSFPLGGCFKLIRNTDGSPATTGVNCTIWIPRRLAKAQ